ncbi:MAG: sugar kinase, partial [Bacilli bacterium]|nr:sugar kinase [Bacilli bacterium]
MMAKIVTLGEIMLRLSSPGCSRLVNANGLDVCYGGGEANVAVSLAHFGHDAYYVTKLPHNPIGDAAFNALRREGVKVDYIARGGDRLGIYYLETGDSMRASQVVYDRANSAIAKSQIKDFNLKDALKGAKIFHFSGITPALSDACAHLTLETCKLAKKLGVLVSCDLNFRKKLWSKEKAQKVMRPLMQYVDICIGNEEDAQNCLGFKPEGDVLKGKTDASGYKNIFKAMVKTFKFKYVATTLRESYSASHNGWKAMLYDGKKFYESKHYDINPIVDRVGSGDSFSAGLLHGLLTYKNRQDAVEFATAASALKHTMPGDFNFVSIKEVETLMRGDGSGRV